MRSTTRIVLFAALVSVSCKEINPLYCPTHPGVEGCPLLLDAAVDGAVAGGTPCQGNSECTSAGLPVCDTSGGDGVCVECTAGDHALCKNTTPICTNHACHACQSTTDCPSSGICLASGACAEESDVAYVDADGTDTTSCTKALPCTTIASALATVTAAAMPRPYLKIHGAISEGVTIARNVSVFADPGASLTRITNGAILTATGAAVVEIDDLTITASRAGADPGIFADSTTALTLKRVTVSANKGNGITCGGSSLTVLGSTLSDNGAVGISCSKGSVTVSSSTFTKNLRGGLIASNGSFDITNSFVSDNGDPANSDVGGVLLNPMPGAANRFEFNTVVNNHVKDFITSLSAGVVCDVAGFAAPNNIIAGNAIQDDANRANANTAGRCLYPTSAINASVVDLKFVSPDNDPRDYHLQAGSIAIGAATTATMVNTDFDGDFRTAAINDQGADQFKPPAL